MQIRELLRSQWLAKNGWTVKKDGYENAMDGLETILTKDNLEMKVRWNDFPYLVTVHCTVTGEMLVRRYFETVEQFVFLTKGPFYKCPKPSSTGSSTPPSPSSYYFLLYDSDTGILLDNGDYLLI